MDKELTLIEKLDKVLELLASSTKFQISNGVPIAELDENEILEFLKDASGYSVIYKSTRIIINII